MKSPLEFGAVLHSLGSEMMTCTRGFRALEEDRLFQASLKAVLISWAFRFVLNFSFAVKSFRGRRDRRLEEFMVLVCFG